MPQAFEAFKGQQHAILASFHLSQHLDPGTHVPKAPWELSAEAGSLSHEGSRMSPMQPPQSKRAVKEKQRNMFSLQQCPVHHLRDGGRLNSLHLRSWRGMGHRSPCVPGKDVAWSCYITIPLRSFQTVKLENVSSNSFSSSLWGTPRALSVT